jgi:general L-amino acid transport system substrate-binding protein
LVAIAAIVYEFYDTRTLKRTVRRGEVLCGVNAGLPGFSIPDDKGNWTGFDVDFCRAVAAAIFDDPKKRSSFRSTPASASPSCRSARSTSSRATPPGAWRARPLRSLFPGGRLL